MKWGARERHLDGCSVGPRIGPVGAVTRVIATRRSTAIRLDDPRRHRLERTGRRGCSPSSMQLEGRVRTADG